MDYRKKCYEISENVKFQYFILFLIVLNAATIGMETFDWPDEITDTLHLVDTIILWIFIIELVIRLYRTFDFIILVALVHSQN